MSKSNHAASVPICITPEYLEKILKNFFGEKSISITDYDITSASAVGENYIGQILRINLVYTRQYRMEKRSIIAKALPQTKLSIEFKKNYDVEKVEMKMMSETLPLMYKELKSRIDSEPFFPYGYYSDVENSIMFMEDLKADGYVVADRKFSLDLDHSMLVVRTLAKMHGASYLMLQKNPDIKNDYFNVFWRKSDGALPGKVIDGSYSYFLKFLNLWPISEEDKDIFRSYDGKICEIMEKSYKMKEDSFNVVIHGDPWTTNMMFKYNNGKVVSVKFFDYQLSNYNSIVLDVIYFIFTSAMEYVKTNHLEDIIKLYYDTFISITGEIEGFSIDTVWKEFKERLEFGFVHAATLRCIMINEGGFDLDAFLEGREAPNNDKMFSDKDFIAEFVNLLPIFKKYGVFKLQS